MRMVAYFAPLQTAVLNLTVIMEDHRGLTFVSHASRGRRTSSLTRSRGARHQPSCHMPARLDERLMACAQSGKKKEHLCNWSNSGRPNWVAFFCPRGNRISNTGKFHSIVRRRS